MIHNNILNTIYTIKAEFIEKSKLLVIFNDNINISFGALLSIFN